MPFQAFYDQHRIAVLRLLVAMVGPDRAQDCFQDAFCKALAAWPPRSAERLGAWMLTIAHRTALDMLRRPAPEPMDDAELPERSSDGCEPEVLARLDASDLWRHVASLPAKQRAAVVLHVVLDQSHRQAAAVLGCSEAAARRSYADGIAALRRTTSTRESAR